MEKQTIYKFFDGKASFAEKEAIRSYLEASPDHEKELLREREFFDALILSEHVGKGIVRQTDNRNSLFRKIAIELLKVAAMVVIAIACGYYFYESEMTGIRQALNIVQVPAGQRVNLTLPDGTNVWLNARSELKYPAVFSGSNREISLDGEAYFEVTHQAGKPFVVKTSTCHVEVLGTKFNVEAYSDSEDFRTSLLEGSVKVSENGNPVESLILTPDYQVTLVDGKLRSGPIADFDLFRWREGLLCFKNMNFEQLMIRFENCYGIRIVIENRYIAGYICSGKFRITDGIDNALRILQKDAKFTYERSKDETIIYIK